MTYLPLQELRQCSSSRMTPVRHTSLVWCPTSRSQPPHRRPQRDNQHEFNKLSAMLPTLDINWLNLVFSKYIKFCIAYDVNKLQTVVNGINSNTNLNLWRDAELKMMPLFSISPLFSILSNTKMPIMPTLFKNLHRSLQPWNIILLFPLTCDFTNLAILPMLPMTRICAKSDRTRRAQNKPYSTQFKRLQSC